MSEADVYGIGRYSNDILTNLNTDIRSDFMALFDRNDFSGSEIGDLSITQGTILKPVPLVADN